VQSVQPREESAGSPTSPRIGTRAPAPAGVTCHRMGLCLGG
jgi:hypothetical protein